MANLPRAVQAQIEAADAILASTSQPQEGQGGSPVDIAKLAAEQPEQQQAEAPPVQEPVVPKAETPPAQPDVWEAKYRTLQGLFNKEVPALQGQVKDLTARYQEVIGQLEKVSKQQQPEATKTSTDPKDVENFGSDLVDMVQRVAQQMLGGVAAKVEGVAIDLEKRIAQLEQVVKGTSQAVNVTAEEMFFNKLTTQVPDWEAVNSDERFLAWLGEVDPMLGQPRQAALDAAQQNLNVARTVSIFNMFKATLPQKPTRANTSVEKQISPSSVATPAATPTDKPVLTQAQISQFYSEMARGKYRGRDSEAAKLEQIINLAIAEGRVR
jgi:hypothetical protein